MVCLHRRLAEIEQLGALLVEADAALVERAPRALDALGSVELCTRGPRGPARDTGDPAELKHAESLARVNVLQEAGLYSRAVEAADEVVAQVASSSRWMQSEALFARAKAYEDAGETKAAERDFHETFSAAVASGHDEMALRASLGLSALLGQAKKPRFDEAERWTDHAEATLARLGEHPEFRGRIENIRGQNDHRRGDYAAARAHFERALEIRRLDLGEDNYRLANYHNNLGHTLSRLGRFEESIAAQERSLELETNHYGEQHPRIARALSALCSAYSNAGDFEHALEAGTRATQILRRTVSEEHPALGTALINLGSAQTRAGRFDEAERSFLDALANVRIANGPQHRRVGLVLNNLGVHYERTDQLDKAVTYHRQAVEVFVAALGDGHPTTATVATNLAGILAKQGELDEAESILRGTLRTLEERLGADHPDTAHPLGVLAEVLVQRGRPAEALPVLERIMALRQPGQAPPEEIAATLYALGDVLWMVGKDRERAVELVTQAAQAYAALGDARHKERERARSWLAERGHAAAG